MKNEPCGPRTTSQWAKDVKKAAIDKDMTLTQVAEKIGYGYQTVSAVINGRYANSSYREIAAKINEVLGTTGLPERTNSPSEKWCEEVKIELIKQKMSISQLSKELGISRDRISLVINGRVMDEVIVSAVNNLLHITSSATATSGN